MFLYIYRVDRNILNCIRAYYIIKENTLPLIIIVTCFGSIKTQRIRYVRLLRVVT